MIKQNIFVLIATVYDNANRVELNNFPDSESVYYIISVQCRNDEQVKIIDCKFSSLRKDIKVYPHISLGLSLNRNFLLRKVGEVSLGLGIAIIADDDVMYNHHVFDRIRKAYVNNDADYITFMIKTPDSEPREYKSYSKINYQHTVFSLMKVSSIEITFNIKKVIDSGVIFDTRFGLGSGHIPKFEESIFLKDLKSKGLKGKFLREYIVTHPFESSGKVEGYQNLQQLEEKLCFFFRYFGALGFLPGLFILIKHYSVLKFGFRNLINAFLLGWRYKK